MRLQLILNKFGLKGEKTGWTYIEFSQEVIQRLNPGCKKSFRVKGKIDEYEFTGLNLLPMGLGLFILPINASIRKCIRKKANDPVELEINLDLTEFQLDIDFMEYLETEKDALNYFNSLTNSHQHYFSKWISAAKTPITKANRISQSIEALINKQNYSQMIRMKKFNDLG